MAKTVFSPEHCEAIRKSLKGRVFSEEHKKKLREARAKREALKRTVAVDTLGGVSNAN